MGSAVFFSLDACRIFSFSLLPALNSYGCFITYRVKILLKLPLIYHFNLIPNSSSKKSQCLSHTKLYVYPLCLCNTILCAETAKTLPVLPQVQIKFHFFREAFPI